MKLGTASALLTALLAMGGTVSVGTATPAQAQTTAQPTVWSPDLSAGETAGVALDGGTARLDPAGTFLAPVEDGSVEDGSLTEGGPDGDAVPTGLLTLPEHRLDGVTDTVGTTVTGDVPAGSTATVDVRGLRANGSWTEWVPAGPGPDGPAATLPEPTSQVQARLVMTGPEGAGPAVTGVTLSARPDTTIRLSEGGAEQAPLNYRVFATREGLVGGTTANGHVIAERDHFVALPSRRALSPRNTSDYSVKVCAPNGRCAFAPVWDVGPWNTRDDYWNPSDRRQEWKDLPQGVPQAQAAHLDGYNGGKDQYGRTPSNPAGIDLGDGLFWDALGLRDNSYVTVDYLWTGSVRLAKVADEGPVLSAPDAAAEVVGIAARRAAVPVECVLGTGAERWLRLGVDQYLAAASVPDLADVGACESAAPDSPATTDEGTEPAEGDPADSAATESTTAGTPTAGTPTGDGSIGTGPTTAPTTGPAAEAAEADGTGPTDGPQPTAGSDATGADPTSQEGDTSAAGTSTAG